MKALLILPLVLLLAACGNHDPQQAEAAKPAQPEARKKPEVKLDAQALRNAGIVVEKVRAESVSETINATGQLTVNEDQSWTVGSLHDGRISSVNVKVGDTVRQGQVLAQMHSHDVHDSRAAYKRAVTELTRAQSAQAQAERVHSRARRLFDLKAMSQQEVEMAAAELRNAEAVVQTARTEVERERVHLIEFLEVPTEPAAGGDGDLVPIKAPAAGIVIDRKATPGTVVSTGQEVFRITTQSSIWMLANVNEADLSHLRIGQPVKVLVRAYPDRAFNGQILRLGEELDPTTRTLRVRVALPNPGGMLKPEMYATAEIERAAARQAIYIPESAPQDLSGNRVVFVRTASGTFEPRPVQTGRSIDGRVEVIAGLSPGDDLVTKGSFILKSELLRSSMEEE